MPLKMNQILMGSCRQNFIDQSLDMIQECCRIVWVWVQLRPMDYVPSNSVELTTKDPQCIVIFFSHFY